MCKGGQPSSYLAMSAYLHVIHSLLKNNFITRTLKLLRDGRPGQGSLSEGGVRAGEKMGSRCSRQ
jgi:hypothetical protein